MTSLHSFTVRSIQGEPVSLTRYEGQVALVVNVASQCGFTPQYVELEALYRHYREQGFVVLGFPCNQFGKQEPGSHDQILDFCRTTYDISFPLFEKIDVNGDNAAPLYEWLKNARPGVLGTRQIKWNFTKFLVGRKGQALKRYAPSVKPESLRSDIESALSEG